MLCDSDKVFIEKLMIIFIFSIMNNVGRSYAAAIQNAKIKNVVNLSSIGGDASTIIFEASNVALLDTFQLNIDSVNYLIDNPFYL